jgi:hypothetical protein
VIKVRYSGRTGNNLAQYAYARLLAERTGFAMINSDLPEWSFIRNTTSPGGKEFICHTNDEVHLNDICGKTPVYYKLEDGKAYIVEGLYQYAEYFIEHRDHIRKFFGIDYPIEINTRDIAIHVRLTDYKTFGKGGSVLHQSYYTDILEKEKFDRLFIFSDEPEDHEYFKPFAKWKPVIVAGTYPYDDFISLMEFDRLIISNSTFAWWAAFLGRPSKVWTPKRWLRNCDNVVCTYYQIPNGIVQPGRFLIEDGYVHNRVSFIIPFQKCAGQDRDKQLSDCIKHIDAMYGKEDIEIIVCEQDDRKPIHKDRKSVV